jgi:hypothetical protein
MKLFSRRSIAKRAVALAIFTLLFSSGIYAQKVLVAGATNYESWLVDVQSKLVSTGMFTSVDYVNIKNTTPTLATLQQYSAVLLFTDAEANDALTLGNNLASYIDAGGGVVDAVFENASMNIMGNYNTTTYRCLNPDYQTQFTEVTLGTILLPAHPIMNGVSSFDGGSSSFRSTSSSLTPTSYRIANYNTGEILVAAREDAGISGTAKRVSINFFPPSSDSRDDFWVQSTDGAKIMANSLLWVAGETKSVPIPLWVIMIPFLMISIGIVIRKFRLL